MSTSDSDNKKLVQASERPSLADSVKVQTYKPWHYLPSIQGFMNNNCISYWHLKGSDIFPENLFGLYWLYRQIALDNGLNYKEHVFIRANPQAKLYEFWISDALTTAVLFEDRVKVALCS